MSHLPLNPLFDDVLFHTATGAKLILWNLEEITMREERRGFYVPQSTAHECTQMQYTSWLCMMPWKPCMWKQLAGKPNATWKLYLAPNLSACSKCARHDNSPLKVEELNFLIFYTFICTRRACQSTARKYWMNYISEREFSLFIPCMMPQLFLCTDTTWKHLLVGTNVLCDKNQWIYS